MAHINEFLTTVSPETKRLAEALIECAAHEKTPPSLLTWKAFKRFLADWKGLDSEQLSEVQAHLAKVGGFVNFRDSLHPATTSQTSAEKVELRGMAKVTRNANNILATQELFERRIEDLMVRVLDKHAIFKPFGYSVKASKEEPGRVVNLALSDLHFGADLDGREVPHVYGSKEEARRLASVILRVCEFKTDYRKESRLVVWLGGDIIQGKIHDPQASLALAEQFADAVWLLRQALVILAGKYPSVEVLCSTGNHDRNTARHQDRATSSKWDSFATQIYVALKAGVSHIKNISVCIPRTPHVEYHPFGHQRVYATHGDTCINPGNPGKSINIRLLETQMATRNNGEVAAGQKPYGLFVVGHVHTGSLTHLASADLITNGCLIPPDPYGDSIGYSNMKNGQYLWESTMSRLVGDSRFLDVDQTTDKDADLDKLVVPWNGEF
jgi:hypothetical protein